MTIWKVKGYSDLGVWGQGHKEQGNMTIPLCQQNTCTDMLGVELGGWEPHYQTSTIIYNVNLICENVIKKIAWKN